MVVLNSQIELKSEFLTKEEYRQIVLWLSSGREASKVGGSHTRIENKVWEYF